MASIETIRNEFLNELWLPLLIEGGKQLYPKLRRNKRMKIFIFTDEDGYAEVSAMVDARITNEGSVFAWTDTLSKASRLQTLKPIEVIGSSRFEDASMENMTSLMPHLPFDIVNFDFSRQIAQTDPQRVEKEVDCIEHMLMAQKNRAINTGFVLLYTTFLDHQSLSCGTIKHASDTIQVDEWNGLNTNGLPPTANLDDDKMNVIENVLTQMSQKHKLSVELKKRISAQNNGKKLYSVGGIFKVGGLTEAI
jgi:hypothetical protein